MVSRRLTRSSGAQRTFSAAPQRRRRTWARQQATINLPNVGVNGSNDLLNSYKATRGILAPEPGMTCGGLWFGYTWVGTAAAVAPGYAVSIGVIVEDGDAPAAELPNPGVDVHADWLWWETFHQPAGTTQTRVDGSSGSDIRRIRSMRRFDEIGMDLYVVVNAGQAGQFMYASSVSLINP